MAPKTAWYVISLCELCVAGKGGECHTPGCALIWKRAPSGPIDTEWACIKMTEQEVAAFNVSRDFARGEL